MRMPPASLFIAALTLTLGSPLSAVPAPNPSNLITNGSFDQFSIPDWKTEQHDYKGGGFIWNYGQAEGWSPHVGSYLEIWKAEDNTFAELDAGVNNYGIHQAVTLSQAGSLLLEWRHLGRSNPKAGENAYSVKVYYRVDNQDVLLKEVDFPEISSQDWASASLEFQVSQAQCAVAGNQFFVAFIPVGNNTFGTLIDDVTLTKVPVDLDVDSDNDNGRGGPPDRLQVEDDVEMSAPGKFVEVNDDTGDSGIPGFATMTGGHFTPMVLELSDDVDLAKATLTLAYDASVPAEPTASVPALTPVVGGVYTPAAGHLRLWTVLADGTTRGQFVPSGVVTAEQLGLSGTSRKVTLLMEGIRPSAAAGDLKITLSVDPDGDGPMPAVKDEVLVTTYKVDLDVDSDNNAVATDIGIAPAEFCLEDQIEDDKTKPGKFVAVNGGDRNENGVPDFADFEKLLSPAQAPTAPGVESGIFTPMNLLIPKGIDLEKAQIRFKYAASDPALVTHTGTAPNVVYPVPAGALRVWTEDGDAKRDPKSVENGGIL